MRCLEEGELRAWLDGEAAAGAHVDGCAACSAAAEALRANAELAATATGVLAPARPLTAEEVEAARERVVAAAHRERVVAAAHRERVVAAAHPPATAPPASAWARPRGLAAAWARRRGLAAAWAPSAARRAPAGPARGWLAATAALVLVLALVATPTGRSAASSFLAQFRSQRFAVVALDPAQAGDLAASLQQLGTVEGGLRDLEPEQVATPTAAAPLVGFPVALPDAAALPAGVDPRPRVTVTPARQLRFTLDAAKVRRYLQAHGRAGAGLPPRLDGATLVANLPAAVLLQYAGADGIPRLVLGQSRELTASVEGGATLEQLRGFLLGLPGLPPQAVRQLKAIGDWRDTLPLPVPADRIDWREATIDGAQGLLLGERSGLGSAAIWQRDGRIYGVAGELRQAQVLRVAESLG
jgi:hypothetical protein